MTGEHERPQLPEHLRGHLTDSAGQPWAGRNFSENPWQHDTGEAPAELLAALRAFRAGEAPSATVVDALRETRLLVPLVAELGEAAVNDAGKLVDKSADLSIVTVAAPDGRPVVPVFSSVATMRTWDAQARPVPVASRQIALAAVDESTDLLILDPGSDTEFAVRRPAVWAIARGDAYIEPWRDQAVLEHAAALMDLDPVIAGIDLVPADPESRLHAPELNIVLQLDARIGDDDRARILHTVQSTIATDALLVERIDSLALTVAVVTPTEPEPTPDSGMAEDPTRASSTPNRRRGWWRRARR